MQGLPSVSVIIPTYNRAALLEATLASVFGQTVPPTEVIVVDDGSTDDTAQVMEVLRREHSGWAERLHYVRQPNSGKSVALNNALERATGEWVAYNDSDDTWLPEKTELQLQALAAMPDCGACFTNALFVNGREEGLTSFERAGKQYPATVGRIPDPVRFVATPPHGVFMQSILVRRDVMRRVGDFDPRLWVSQDTDFIFRLALNASLCYVNRPLVRIDRSTGRSVGLTTQFTRRSVSRLQAFERSIEKWIQLTRASRPDVLDDLAKLLAGVRNELSNEHLLAGMRVEARRTMRDAVQARVSPRLIVKLALLYVAPSVVERAARRRMSRRTQSQA
jgi:glycosyltransferase involved in cell wall biosynthesis